MLLDSRHTGCSEQSASRAIDDEHRVRAAINPEAAGREAPPTVVSLVSTTHTSQSFMCGCVPCVVMHHRMHLAHRLQDAQSGARDNDTINAAIAADAPFLAADARIP